MGAGAAYDAYQSQPSPIHRVSRANQSEFIAVSGTAAHSVTPESVRLVLAVTSEAETSLQCSEKVEAAITQIRDSTKEFGFKDDDIIEDFIVVVPKYRWELGTLRAEDNNKEGEGVVKEVSDGFRMQTNLHVLCQNETQAMAAMKLAFQAGVHEIISFDYWHSDLDRLKKDVLKKAVEEAKSKADILLTVFDDKPKVLNVDHSTSVSFPKSLYKTITPRPSLDENLIPYGWRNKYIRIQAHRPLTTFYQGIQEYSDSSPPKPAMKPEITILSSVTLTYGSPARIERLEIERSRQSE